MKKPFVLIAAIVAVVGLCAAVAVAKETTKVPVGATIEFTGPGVQPGGLDGRFVNGTFSGEVTARGPGDSGLNADQRQHKGECQKQRKVVLYEKAIRGLPAMRRGADRSDNRGRYRIEARTNATWVWVKVGKRIIENDGEKVVCKQGGSEKKTLDELTDPSLDLLARN